MKKLFNIAKTCIELNLYQNKLGDEADERSYELSAQMVEERNATYQEFLDDDEAPDLAHVAMTLFSEINVRDERNDIDLEGLSADAMRKLLKVLLAEKFGAEKAEVITNFKLDRSIEDMQADITSVSGREFGMSISIGAGQPA